MSYTQLSLVAGPKMLFTGYSTYNEFRNSFNSYNQDIIDKELKPFSIGKGYQIGLTYELGLMFFNICTYNKLLYSRSVLYNEGNKRHFDLKFNHFSTGLGFGYGKQEEMGFWLYCNLNSGSLILKTYYKYADGSKNFSPSKIVNGKYTCLVSMKPSIVARFIYPLMENLSLFADVEYYFPYNIRFKEGTLKFYLYDIDDDKIMNDGMSCLPTEYDTYMEMGGRWSDYYSEYGNKWVEGDISGLDISIGVKFDLPDSDVYE